MSAVINFVYSQILPSTTKINWNAAWNIEVGDTVYLFMSRRGDAGPRLPALAGWNEIYDDGGLAGGMVAWRKWDGTEGIQTVIEFGGTSQQGLVDIAVVKKNSAADPAISPPQAIFKVISASTTTWTLSGSVPEEVLTPTPGEQEYLWMALAHTYSSGASVSVYPESFPDNRLHTLSTASGAACGLGRCSRSFVAASMSDVTFEMNIATTGVIALIAIPAATAPNFKPWFAHSPEVL